MARWCCNGLLFALRMKVYPVDHPLHLIEAYVVETLKAHTGYCPHSVVRDQEMLLPPHEDVFSLAHVRDYTAFPRIFLKGSEGAEHGPIA